METDALLIGLSLPKYFRNKTEELLKVFEFLKKRGLNCFEWSGFEKRDQADPYFLSDLFRGIIYRSVHLPDFDSANWERQIILADRIVKKYAVDAAVTHPLKNHGAYPEPFYRKMISFGIPLAIENMDIRKTSGFELAELEKLIKSTGLNFVLDLQHAYERDHSMKYAKDLFDALKTKIAHLHVSGESPDNIHSLVHRSTNRKSILDFLETIFSERKFPIILEGGYKSLEEIFNEIVFLKNALGY